MKRTGRSISRSEVSWPAGAAYPIPRGRRGCPTDLPGDEVGLTFHAVSFQGIASRPARPKADVDRLLVFADPCCNLGRVNCIKVGSEPHRLKGLRMRRRALLGLLTAAAATWPRRSWAGAEQRRIGVILGFPEQDQQTLLCVQAFTEGLQKLGLEDGHAIRIDYRWPGIDADRARTFVRELIALKPDVIVAGTNQVVTIAMQETRSIPIVFVFIGDPVGSRYAASINRPGRNLTGFANFEQPMGSKWLEVLKAVSPGSRRVGFMYHPAASPHVEFWHSAQESAPRLGFELTGIPVRTVPEIETLMTGFAEAGNGNAVVVAPHALTLGSRSLITGLASRYKLPGVYGDAYFARSGGLLSYGVNAPSQLQRAATYVNAILKGADPAGLPVQLPTRYEMIINLVAAKALELEVPPALLARADEVIE
ncbi:ABC transporter substrate-binding protein [Methylobacterium mesophilicum]|uniref:ABC transporter substrate-binding protein n=1 Tax=Methylobacterium mesophilicum TaxID=39956 RepID=UPI001303C345|nr:ABC transporter substrate-binding protein [Methylobacterium mesophilicum]